MPVGGHEHFQTGHRSPIGPARVSRSGSTRPGFIELADGLRGLPSQRLGASPLAGPGPRMPACSGNRGVRGHRCEACHARCRAESACLASPRREAAARHLGARRVLADTGVETPPTAPRDGRTTFGAPCWGRHLSSSHRPRALLSSSRAARAARQGCAGHRHALDAHTRA